MGTKKPVHQQAAGKIANSVTERKKYSQMLKTKKTAFLVIFAAVYGLIFINYIDIITPGGNIGGYHLWLILMYFMPFALLSVIDIKNWKLTLALGLITSLMNDVFYGSVRVFMGQYVDLSRYYSLWLIPQSTNLFTLNIGVATINVQSWMMAASIYLRLAGAFLLLDGYKHLPINWNTLAHLNLKRNKIGNLKPIAAYEPEIMMIPADMEEPEETMPIPQRTRK